MKKIHRFMTPYQKLGDIIELRDTETIHQMKDVLKLRVGENCSIVEKDADILCSIIDMNKDRIQCRIVEVTLNESEPTKNVVLYLAILKKENFELALQKASEIGITTIVPVITTRTVKTGLNMERLEKIAREAGELSGRSSSIEIKDITPFSEALEKDTSNTKILFDISGSLLEAWPTGSTSIYIGPEGGFTEEELSLVKEHNITIASLGNLTLRGETAAIVASYLAVQ